MAWIIETGWLESFLSGHIPFTILKIIGLRENIFLGIEYIEILSQTK